MSALTAISSGNQLAVLMLEIEHTQEQAERQQLNEARVERTQALEREVSKMREAADEAFTGALVGAGLTIGGGAASVYGSSQQLAASQADNAADAERLGARGQTFTTLGKTASDAAPMMEKLITSTDTNANAARARNEAEQASWRADDADKRADRAHARQEQALTWLRDQQASEREVIRSILNRM